MGYILISAKASDSLDEVARAVSNALGIGAWQAQQSENYPGGRYCRSSVVGFEVHIFERALDEELSSEYGFGITIECTEAIAHRHEVADAVADAASRCLARARLAVARWAFVGDGTPPTIKKYVVHDDRYWPEDISVISE